MPNAKRFVVATLAGVLFGFVCLAMAWSASGGLPGPVAWQIVASRALIGVAIGASALALGHWSVHGLVMGALFSLPLAFSGLMAPENLEFPPAAMFGWTLGLGMVYGLFIELITSLVFRARATRPTPPARA